MSAPILFGSPRAQKDYVSPKTEGIAPRYTDRGYTQRSSVSRYVIPPPPLPVIATGYNGMWTGGEGWASNTPTGDLSTYRVEKYDFATDAPIASPIDIVGVPGFSVSPSSIYEEFYGAAYQRSIVTSHGSDTHGFREVVGGSSTLSRLTPINLGSLMFFPYANATTQNVQNDSKDPISIVGNYRQAINDKTNMIGIISGGKYIGPNAGTTRLSTFPFATGTFSNDLSNLEIAEENFTNPTNLSRRNTSGGNDLNSGFVVGGRKFEPVFADAKYIEKYPFANRTANIRINGMETNGPYDGVGLSSATHGYLCGFVVTLPSSIGYVNSTQKYPFTLEADLTESLVADLAAAGDNVAGVGGSSNTTGYNGGGSTTPGAPTGYPYSANKVNKVSKFPFASDNNVTALGNLSYGQIGSNGTTES